MTNEQRMRELCDHQDSVYKLQTEFSSIIDEVTQSTPGNRDVADLWKLTQDKQEALNENLRQQDALSAAIRELMNPS